jgi:uncharacterized phage protein (TIGR02218 family)
MPKDIGLIEPEATERRLFELYKITPRDGSVLRYTDCDQDLPVDVADGAGRIDWLAAPGVKRSDARAGIDLQIDDLRVTVPNVDLAVTVNLATPMIITRPIAHWAKVRYFHGARVDLYLYDHKVVAAALHSTWEVQGTQSTVDQVEFTLEAFTAKLDRVIPRMVFQTDCNHALGDRFCGVDLDLYEVSSTATAATLNTVTYGTLTPSTPPPPASSYADSWFDKGEIVFMSGNLIGLRATIATHVGSVVTVLSPFPELPDVGSIIALFPGCLKRIVDCRDKFGSNRTEAPLDWFRRFFGFPYMEEMEKTVGRGGAARASGGTVGGGS